jgi:hypothetical protein
MGLSITAGCDTAWIQTRDRSDTSCNDMQGLRSLRHSGARGIGSYSLFSAQMLTRAHTWHTLFPMGPTIFPMGPTLFPSPITGLPCPICKSLWIRASAKWLKCKCKCIYQIDKAIADYFQIINILLSIKLHCILCQSLLLYCIYIQSHMFDCGTGAWIYRLIGLSVVPEY